MKGGLECHRLTFTRQSPDGREKRVLNDLNATFFAGQLALIAGETGAGKSTLLHALAGLLRPTQGEVLADGEPVSRWVSAHRDLWRRKVGIVFQSDRLIGDLSAMENVFLPLVPRGYRPGECRRLAIKALRRLQADGFATEAVHKLSGGERQRVAIARALVSQPSYLLVDEPTAHQDGNSAAAIADTLLAVAAAGATVVVTAHDARILTSGITRHRYQLECGRLRMKG
jgi:ABC-type lipoprotein export system ATPase subunit